MIPPPPISPKCCDQKNDVTSDAVCRMLPEIMDQYRYLCDRHKQLTYSKSQKRIKNLAEPVEKREKYPYPCFCRDGVKRKIEILRMDERACTRTEQLAYPSVSQLLALKSRSSYTSFEPLRKHSVNKLMHKSLNSLYSRLSNVSLPQPPKKRERWSYEEWLVHDTYMHLLSRPKKLSEPEKSKEVRKSRVLQEMRRTNRLAKPKTYVETARNEWRLTDSLKNYVPTKRIQVLAKQTRPQPVPYNGFQVKPEALTYKPSQRIKQLAVAPAQRYKKEVKVTLSFFRAPPKALTYKPSQRIIDLSQPLVKSDRNQKTNPYKVKPSALNYKITPRLARMAKPKTHLP